MYKICPPNALQTITLVATEFTYNEKENALPLLQAVAEYLERELIAYWLTITNYRLLDTNLPSKSVVNTCSSHIPSLMGATLMQLYQYFEDLNSSSDVDENDMLMARCISMLSAVEWVEVELNSRVPSSLTYDAAIAYITRISRSYTALGNELGTMWGKRVRSLLRIAEGRIVKWGPAAGNRKLLGLHGSIHQLKIK